MMKRSQPIEFIMTKANIPAQFGVSTVTVLVTNFVILLAALSMSACTEKLTPPIKANAPLVTGPATAPSTTVLGVEPAGATREAAATTSKAKTEISKEQQSTAMPLPGQANDHSVLLPTGSPQRAASR